DPRPVYDGDEEEREDGFNEDPCHDRDVPSKARRGSQRGRAEMRGLPYGGGDDDEQSEGRRKRSQELRSPVDGREPGRNLPASERGVSMRRISSFSVGSAQRGHAMYEADPRSKPRTNSRLSSDGCHAASGKTRFGKNRVVSPEIWVTRASTPNKVSRIRWDCSRQTRSSTKPREWRYSCRRT